MNKTIYQDPPATVCPFCNEHIPRGYMTPHIRNSMCDGYNSATIYEVGEYETAHQIVFMEDEVYAIKGDYDVNLITADPDYIEKVIEIMRLEVVNLREIANSLEDKMHTVKYRMEGGEHD